MGGDTAVPRVKCESRLKEHDAIKMNHRGKEELLGKNMTAETKSSVKALGDKVEEISQEHVAKSVIEDRRYMMRQ